MFWNKKYSNKVEILLKKSFSLFRHSLLLIFISKFWSCRGSVSTDFFSNSTGDTSIHWTAFEHSHANWDGVHDHIRHVLWEDIFKRSTAAASKFCEGVHVEIDAKIIHRKYQVKPHLYSLHGFQELGLLPQLIKIPLFDCTDRKNLFLMPSPDRLATIVKQSIVAE